MADKIRLAERRAQWEETRSDVDHIVDGRGTPVDEGIKEAVTALRVLGFPTRASCEGHADYGLPYPWVEIRTSESLEREQQEFENLEHQQRMLGLLRDFYTGRDVPFDTRLSFSRIGGVGAFRIQSIGGDVMVILSQEEKREKQRLYREETSAFAAFLKNKFLAG